MGLKQGGTFIFYGHCNILMYESVSINIYKTFLCKLIYKNDCVELFTIFNFAY